MCAVVTLCPASRVRLFALLLACDAYTELILTRSGLIDDRYLCLKSRTARVESSAAIAELCHSERFLPVAIVTGIIYSNLGVLSQAPSPNLHLQQNKQPASTISSQPPPPPPPTTTTPPPPPPQPPHPHHHPPRAAEAYVARGGWCSWWCSGLCVLCWL